MAVGTAAEPGAQARPEDASTEARGDRLEPLPAHEEHDRGPVTKPDQARGWDEEPGIETEDAILFGPRALLFVPNLALKLVFLPVRALAVVLTRHAVVEHTIDLLYNDERTAAILPVLSVQTGYGLSYGATAFHDDLLGHGEEASLTAKFGGIFNQGYQLSFAADRVRGSRLWLDAVTRYEVKPAILFYGFGNAPARGGGTALGPRDAAVATRFRQERFLAATNVGASLGERGKLTNVGLTAIYNHRVFGPEDRDFSEPSIETVYDTSRIPGFDRHVNVFEVGPRIVHDTRNSRAVTSHGFYLDLFGARTLPITDASSYWHYGLQTAVFVDLYHGSRVLVARALLEGVLGSDEEIPFTELPRLGGPQRLRGYDRDRFRDQIAALGTLEYHYPVHQMVAGNVFFDAGRVGRRYDDVFGEEALEDWKLGGGLGLILHSLERDLLRFEVAYGDRVTFFFTTDPLEAFGKRHEKL